MRPSRNMSRTNPLGGAGVLGEVDEQREDQGLAEAHLLELAPVELRIGQPQVDRVLERRQLLAADPGQAGDLRGCDRRRTRGGVMLWWMTAFRPGERRSTSVSGEARAKCRMAISFGAVHREVVDEPALPFQSPGPGPGRRCPTRSPGRGRNPAARSPRRRWRRRDGRPGRAGRPSSGQTPATCWSRMRATWGRA